MRNSNGAHNFKCSTIDMKSIISLDAQHCVKEIDAELAINQVRVRQPVAVTHTHTHTQSRNKNRLQSDRNKI